MSSPRENLRQELEILLTEANASEEVKFGIDIILDKYDVTDRHTEIIPYQEDENWKIMNDFLISKTVSGRTEKTVEYYRIILRKFLSMVDKPVKVITSDDIRLYMALRLRRDKVSKVTLGNEWRVLSSFFQWLEREDLIQKNPVDKVEPVRAKADHEPSFSDMEIEMIRGCLKDSREKALVETMLSTGCRVSEITKMQISELSGNKIVAHGKGEKDRTVYLNAKAVMALQNYLNERKGDNPYIFPITPGRVESIIRDIGKRAGVDDVHPHRFRKTFATSALRHGMPLEQVSELLGHANLDTTKIYITIADDDLEQAHRKYVV